MKNIFMIVILMMSSISFANETRFANIVSVTPLTDQIIVIKSMCPNISTGNQSIFGSWFSSSDGNESGKCQQIQTLEPTPGGYEIVYELDGKQYTTKSNKFPRGKTIAVQMTPTIIQ